MIAMQAAISGLSTLQKMLDVVGGNLSNANTPGYKTTEMTFKETFAEIQVASSAGNGNVGSINPRQLGTGVAVGTMVQNFNQGGLDVTGRTSDLAIDGDGFFCIREGTGGIGFTRAGNFSVDRDGYLTNADGLKVQGWNAVAGAIDTDKPVEGLWVPVGRATLARATSSVQMGGNLDASQAVYSVGPPVTGGRYVTSAAVYDSLGYEHQVDLTFTKVANVGTEGGRWDWTATTDGIAAGSGTCVFTAAGQYDQANSTPAKPTIAFTPTNGASAVSADLDLTGITQLSTPGQYSVLTRSQNGLPPGTLQSFSVGADGTLAGLFSNGLTDKLGQIALATFTNNQGLERGEAGIMHESAASGTATILPAGNRQTITSGALESSNVDIGREFTRMITAQRSFEANARMVTTMDQIMSELTRLRQ